MLLTLHWIYLEAELLGGKSELIISAAVFHVYYFTAAIHTSDMGYSSKMLFKCTLDNIQHPKALEIHVSISVYN